MKIYSSRFEESSFIETKNLRGMKICWQKANIYCIWESAFRIWQIFA